MSKFVFTVLALLSFSGVANDTEKFLKSDGSEKLQKFVKDNKSFFDKMLLDHIVAMDNCFMNEKENYKCKKKYFDNYHGRYHERDECYSWYKNKPKQEVKKCQKHYDTKNFYEFEKMLYEVMLRWNVFDKRKELVSNVFRAEYIPRCWSQSVNCTKAPYRNSGVLNITFGGFVEERKKNGDWGFNVDGFAVTYRKKLEKYEDLLNQKLIVGISLSTNL